MLTLRPFGPEPEGPTRQKHRVRSSPNQAQSLNPLPVLCAKTLNPVHNRCRLRPDWAGGEIMGFGANFRVEFAVVTTLVAMSLMGVVMILTR